MVRKFKYLAAFSLPITVAIALLSEGWLSFLPLLVYFGLVPLLELFFPPDGSNLDEQERELAKSDHFYDLLLFSMVPIQFGMLVFFLFQVQEPGLDSLTYWGRVVSMGLMCGIIGINVGHELGHRPPGLAHKLGELLMLSSLENHFTPYHNHGHHRYVATPEDPATARKNEPVFLFWFRSHFGSYVKAWQIEAELMRKKDLPWWSPQNRMIRYTSAQLIMLVTIYLFFGAVAFIAFLKAAIIGIILLETVNYIEHYGLLRKKKENGRYERVLPRHSWNSDFVIGRVVLFELSRHSDHHHRASKHFQVLDSVEESPQMPTGYPGMMLFALIPPLWFRYMNRRIEAFQSDYQT